MRTGIYLLVGGLDVVVGEVLGLAAGGELGRAALPVPLAVVRVADGQGLHVETHDPALRYECYEC